MLPDHGRGFAYAIARISGREAQLTVMILDNRPCNQTRIWSASRGQWRHATQAGQGSCGGGRIGVSAGSARHARR
jgi:hypothetical protein